MSDASSAADDAATPIDGAADADRTSDEGVDAAPAGTAGRSESRSESHEEMVRRLEREGDVAADYLEELLDIADLDGDIDLDVENDRAMVSIVGDRLSHLVGADGAALDALQELTRLAVLRTTGERSRLMLDVAGARARRRTELTDLARATVEQARTGGEPVRLEPMNPFERKVVHDAVAAEGLRSESEGVEPSRRVVVYPS